MGISSHLAVIIVIIIAILIIFTLLYNKQIKRVEGDLNTWLRVGKERLRAEGKASKMVPFILLFLLLLLPLLLLCGFINFVLKLPKLAIPVSDSCTYSHVKNRINVDSRALIGTLVGFPVNNAISRKAQAHSKGIILPFATKYI